ncbi:hypothetical protein ACFVZM_06535 [Streptomyces sioyaensis]|uniref:hypothetical protein n=1 Tax=Streptomyces sioyaensis TaxID=67364 RepID=UPI00369BFF38
MPVVKIAFETENCSRCDGTGRYSYNPMHGRMCFKCKGAKRTLTQRGQAARKAYDDAVDMYCGVLLWEVVPGDVIWHTKANGRKGWVTVRSVRKDAHEPEHAALTTDGQGGLIPFETRVRLWRPEVLNEIRKDIARLHEGATITE